MIFVFLLPPPPMNLVLDSGNTLTKIGLFSHGKLIETEVLKFNEKMLIKKILSHNPERVILSSVGNNLNIVYKQLKKKIPTLIMGYSLKLPFKNLYQSQKTLGNDRLALSAGAMTFYPRQNCLVISAGTCITYNFITSDTKYLGGAISPGMQMRFESLHSGTSRLPFVKKVKTPALIGKTTTESIQSGVIHGICEEITGIAKQYSATYPKLWVILCGGDAEYLQSLVKIPVILHPHLVLYGLNRILEENN